MAIRYDHEGYRKLFVREEGRFAQLSAFAKMLAAYLLKLADSRGRVWVGDDAPAALARAMGAPKGQRRQLPELIHELLDEGYLLAEGEYLRIKNFARAQARRGDQADAPADPAGARTGLELAMNGDSSGNSQSMSGDSFLTQPAETIESSARRSIRSDSSNRSSSSRARDEGIGQVDAHGEAQDTAPSKLEIIRALKQEYSAAHAGAELHLPPVGIEQKLLDAALDVRNPDAVTRIRHLSRAEAAAGRPRDARWILDHLNNAAALGHPATAPPAARGHLRVVEPPRDPMAPGPGWNRDYIHRQGWLSDEEDAHYARGETPAWFVDPERAKMRIDGQGKPLRPVAVVDGVCRWRDQPPPGGVPKDPEAERRRREDLDQAVRESRARMATAEPAAPRMRGGWGTET